MFAPMVGSASFKFLTSLLGSGPWFRLGTGSRTNNLGQYLKTISRTKYTLGRQKDFARSGNPWFVHARFYQSGWSHVNENTCIYLFVKIIYLLVFEVY